MNTTTSTATFEFSSGVVASSTTALSMTNVRNPQSEYVSSVWTITSYYVENSTASWSINQDTSITVLPNEYGDMTSVLLTRKNSSNIQVYTDVDFTATSLNPIPLNSVVKFTLSLKQFELN